MDKVYTEAEEESLVSAIMDIGEVLLTAGAEVNRVEDTIRRIGLAYGFARVEIFTITNSMVLTVHTAGPDGAKQPDGGSGRIITQTRRITSSSVDLEKVGRANALSRSVCAEPVPVAELRSRVSEIVRTTPHYGLPVKYFAFLITAASFAVFFGGSIMDGVAAAITSLAVCTFMHFGTKLKVPPIISILITSVVMTGVITGLISLGLGESFDKITIGNIMLLIPGINLTTAIRDIITGDTVSGLMGMCDALLKAFAIAVGCVSVMLLTGMV